MGMGAGLYMYNVIVKKFTFAISSPDEFLCIIPCLKLGGCIVWNAQRPCGFTFLWECPQYSIRLEAVGYKLCATVTLSGRVQR